MTHLKWKLCTISMLALAGILWGACKKYEDPPATNGDDRLTNHYCNNPYAINYNWGFPGIPDSTVCIFPNDRLTGSWLFNDTVLLPDSSIAEIVLRQLVFTSREDTSRNHLAVTGFCNNGQALQITADRYGNILTDTLIEYTDGGQFFCSESDTISGQMNFYFQSDSLLKINLSVLSPDGLQYHTGTGIKQ